MADSNEVGNGWQEVIRRRSKHAFALAGMALAAGAIAYSTSMQPGAPAQVGQAVTPTSPVMSSAVVERPTEPTRAPSPTPRAMVAEAALPAPTAEPQRAVATERAARPAEVITHVVRDGETLSEIADAYGISPDSIKWANDGVDDPDFLSVGQKLIVPPLSGILHTVLEGDTLLEVAELYDVEMEAVVEANALEDPYPIAVGQLLIVPGGTPPEPVVPMAQVVALAEPSRAESSARASREPTPAPKPAPAVARTAGLSAANAAFIEKLVGPAQRSMLETGVPASVTIAQAIWEADWGRSGLAIKANNYFGIKGRPNPGPAGVIWLDTWEHVNGRNITVKEPFKVYNSLLESVLDHGVFIRANPRYAEAMKNRGDPKTFIRLVHRAGYATDPAYTDKIINLMDRYNLYVYDQI